MLASILNPRKFAGNVSGTNCGQDSSKSEGRRDGSCIHTFLVLLCGPSFKLHNVCIHSGSLLDPRLGLFCTV